VADVEKILRLVSEGVLSPEEADEILGASAADSDHAEQSHRPTIEQQADATRGGGAGRHLRVQVSDGGRQVINLRVPMNIAGWATAFLPGLPDDYADRYLPEIMARFSRAYPNVELTVTCEPSVELVERIDSNEIDLAIVTDCGTSRASEMFRRERLLWVTSNRHSVHLEEPIPLALGRPSCGWRRAAIECLETIGRPHHIAYTSANASAVASAVLSGLAVSIFPESGLRPGMRVLNPADGFPELPGCRVGLIRNAHESSALADALAEHIISSLDNLSEAAQAAE
jgi:DNA-binding transcriptional LysR family regulator